MMLVEHDVEAEFVGRLIFVVVAMKQVGGDARITFAVREDDAQRAVVIVPGRIIGLLGELIELSCHALLNFSGKRQNFLGK